MRFPTSGRARAVLAVLVVIAALGPASLIRAAQPPPHPVVHVRSAPTDIQAPDVTLAVARLAARDTLWRESLLWNDTIRWNVAIRANEQRAYAYAHMHVPRRSRPAVSAEVVSGVCGGDLPSCCIMRRESGGSPTAQNPSSSASGKWQFMHDTWAGYGGYENAKDAPASVQDERARQVWAGGAGASNWAGPGC